MELDDRVAQSQQLLQERDTEISRLRRELMVSTKLYLVLSVHIHMVHFYVQDQTSSKGGSVAALRSPPRQSHVS